MGIPKKPTVTGNPALERRMWPRMAGLVIQDGVLLALADSFSGAVYCTTSTPFCKQRPSRSAPCPVYR